MHAGTLVVVRFICQFVSLFKTVDLKGRSIW